jgi:MoxR-like ATPase
MSSIQQQILEVQQHLNEAVIGQTHLTERILIALLANGHLLVEGAPGLAKTRTIRKVGELLECDFHRIQFTPDLLPADITGTEIYRPQDGSFHFQQGPVFHNLVLADEINRAPAKVQSALLEAMGERQVTVGRETYQLPELFLVMATQNPLEQEGTYPLPEAQLDRFLMMVLVDYPEAADELRILQLTREEASTSAPATPLAPLPQTTVFAARQEILGLHMSPELERYLVEIVLATRKPETHLKALTGKIQLGASPRGTIALDVCARARAWLRERDFVTPDDIQDVCADVLRHRLILSYEAEAEGMRADDVLERLLRSIPVP